MNQSSRALVLASAILLSTPAIAEQAEDINYGDPTASFRTVGLSASNTNAAQLNTMLGFGKHIVQFDLTALGEDRRSGTNYRARYFYVNDGLGFSGDVIGTHTATEESTLAVAGAMYKWTITDNVMLFPMLSAGQNQVKDKTTGGIYTTAVVQPGLYALYAFDEGHWLYANPKMTHSFDAPAGMAQFDPSTWEVELGGGYMLNEWSSAEFKVEHTVRNSTPGSKDNTIAWLKYAVYF